MSTTDQAAHVHEEPAAGGGDGPAGPPPGRTAPPGGPPGAAADAVPDAVPSGPGGPPAGVPGAGAAPGPTSKRATLEALSGLLLALFVALLSSTIVANALPTITSALAGTQSQYTWVVTAALLAATATTPIWGKLADLFSKKLLVQLAIGVFVLGSALCGLAQSMGVLIGFRVLQGVGMGGLQALSQVVIGALIPPRERGRYSGYIGATMASATIGGPLLGGLIVDTSWLGWRWTFYVCVPLALVALTLLQKTLHVPTLKRQVSIDWVGATLITAGVCVLLIWVTFAGNQFAWLSWQTALMAGGGLLALVLTVLVERRVAEPVIPLPIVRDRTTALAIVASVAVGVGMFGTSVFFGQYFQISRGWSPTRAGLATIPMIVGLLIASTLTGQLITRFGRWKRYLLTGSVLLVTGTALLGTIDHTTPYWHLAVFMALVGLGLGMSLQNLVLAVQNTVDVRSIGAATSVVTFFRSMSGAVGVSVLGSLAATQVTTGMAAGLRDLGGPARPGGGSQSLALDALPAPVLTLLRSLYGDAIGHVFAITAVIAAVGVVAVLFIREVPLRRTNALPDRAAGEGAARGDGGPPARAAADDTPPADAVAAGDDAPPVAAAAPAPDTAADDGARPARAAAAGAPPARAAANGRPRARTAATGTPVPRGPADGTAPTGVTATGAPPPRVPADGVPPDGVPADAAEHGPRTGRVVVGRVLRGDGRGLPGAAVTLTDTAGRQVDRAVTGADGGYTVRATASGTYLLIAAAARLAPNAAMVALDGVPVQRDLVLAGGSVLRGQVRAADGDPLPEALVTLTDPRGDVVASSVTGEDGRFEFAELLAGTYTLTGRAAGHQPGATTAQVGTGVAEHDLVLASGARVAGVVRAPGDARPLPDSTVSLLDGNGAVVATVRTGEAGAFCFDDLVAGDYTIVASTYAPVATGVRVAPGVVVDRDVTLVADH